MCVYDLLDSLSEPEFRAPSLLEQYPRYVPDRVRNGYNNAFDFKNKNGTKNQNINPQKPHKHEKNMSVQNTEEELMCERLFWNTEKYTVL